MKKFIGVFAVLGVLVAAAPVLADWNLGDSHKMHFPQLPDEDGWDVNATFPKVLADDWQCSATGWVEDIHWWGSWKNGEEGTITSFHVSIHSNFEGPPSTPDTLLWEREVTNFAAVPIDPPTYQGWYDPNDGTYVYPDHQSYFQYNLVDIWDPFWQDEGIIYWLDISANVLETDRFWGWKSSEDHFMDDAVMGHLPAGAPWTPLYEPPDFTQTLDLAFVITPEPATLSLLALGGLAVISRRRR